MRAAMRGSSRLHYLSARSAVLAALVLSVVGCAAVEPPGPNRNTYCAQLFDQLDGYDWLPTPTVGFNFRQMQLARIRQANCITFTRDLASLGALTGQPTARPTTSGAAFRRARAVQAGIVTNADDASLGMAYFADQGFRSRSVGYAGLGTRIYVEANTLSDIERIVDLAQSAGFVGPYPSRYVLF